MDDENKYSQSKSQMEAFIRELSLRGYLHNASSLREFPELNVSSGLTDSLPDQLKSIIGESVQLLAEDKFYPSQRPSTSQATPQYRPIRIIIGENNDIDADQPSTSSSLDGSQPESLQDAKVYNRIRELREAGFWDSTRLPKCEDPPRKKTHWDFFLEEVVWMATDFKNERKTKRLWARRMAYNAKASWRKAKEAKKEQINSSSFVKDEKEAKRVCASIARMVREFWQNVDKVVDFRANEIVESKKRKALDQHLDFLVGAADKITSLIQERLVDSPTVRHSTKTSINDEFETAEVSEDDDETTIEREEEADLSNDHQEQELDELYKERDMDIDQLLTTLPAGYIESLGYKIPIKNKEEDVESSRIESMDDDTTRTTTAATAENGGSFHDKPDLRNVDYVKLSSDNSEVRRQELDHIAEAALEFQPRGYTLETTEVKTEVPFLICGQLREYQLVGLDWLVTLYEKNLNGILADEMGLGKTIQTIALLAHLACARAIWGPHLIIVPTSVILNWEMELNKWCPSLKVLTYFGSAKERAEKRKGWSKVNAFHVCITSYKLATQDIRVFKKKAWQYLILDEAQNIKNFRSQRWQMLLGLRSRRRLLLTGTPLQNSLMELWALLHFLMPSVFASHDDFKEWFHSPITGMVEGTTEIDQALVQRLHKVLRPFILRRLKSEVEKQLPTKTETIIPCSLSKRQRYLYNEFLSKTTTVDSLRSGNMLSVLGVIMQLRKCCNHPNLFEPRPVVSPYVAPMISPQFPQRLISIRHQPKNTFLLGNAYSSKRAWDIFTEVSSTSQLQADINAIHQPEESPFPAGLKFVMDEFGGHFYKSKQIKEQQQGQVILNETSHDANQTEFVNNTRKRRIPTQLQPPDEPNKPQNAPNVTDLFQSAFTELKAMQEQRDLESRRRGIWLTEITRRQGSPMLSHEAVSSAKIGKNMVDIVNLAGSTSQMAQAENLIEVINERIAQNLLNWIEPSLDRFLLCVRKLLIDGCYELPFANAAERHDYQLHNLNSMKIYSAQNNLAHRVEIYSKLEFPELRLIEYDCGKLQVLAKLLVQLYEHKHRCLIFTQMSRMLDILQAFLSHHNYKYFRLDGATRIDQRQAMMERFNSDDSIFCFILSTRSGGIGVNLTGADTVIFYDSDWNPTMDAQAQDRCHRIGQTRNVTIYRLISERTIEENILTKSMQKRRLGEMAIDEGEFTPEFFKSATNLRELFINEGSVADIIAPVIDQAKSSKEIETAMLSVEDQQDVVAAQMARQETKTDSADFDENIAAIDYDTMENPSEQYLELINALKPVERYAVNFLANEYRPALDKEFEEAEALIKAKQKELMEQHEDEDDDNEQESNDGGSEDNGALQDIAYDAGAVNELPFFAAFDAPFEEIPTWMPPSPPNSVEGDRLDCWYTPIDGTFLYEPWRMPEERLPPLPLLISLNEVPPRIRPRQRKTLVGIPSTRSSPVHKRQSIGKGGGGGKLTKAEKKEHSHHQQKQQQLPTPATSVSAFLLSPPNTPMPVSALDGQQQQPIGSAIDRAEVGAQPSAQQKVPPTGLISSSVDDSIESTVRKSRKQAGSHGAVSRYIIRYTGPTLLKPEKRLATDPTRVVYKLVCPEWRTIPAALPVPSATHSEQLDYGGPAWGPQEDRLLLKVITVKHGSSTEMLAQKAGIQFNWDFVSQYVTNHSSHYRSPRQCALRYQSNILRCDEPAEKPGSSSSSSSSASRRQRPSIASPQSVVFDTNFCAQEVTGSVRKRTSLLAEIGQQRRREQPAGQQPQQTPQLLCMSGRIPPGHEQRLLELGARHTNVVRPMDILEAQRERARKQQQIGGNGGGGGGGEHR